MVLILIIIPKPLRKAFSIPHLGKRVVSAAPLVRESNTVTLYIILFYFKKFHFHYSSTGLLSKFLFTTSRTY